MKKIINYLLKKIAIKVKTDNIIVLESFPVFTDNSKAIYDEFQTRDKTKKFKYVWIDYDGYSRSINDHNPDTLIIDYNKNKIVNRLRIKYYLLKAKLLISGNRTFEKIQKKQYYFFTSHGSALKNCSDYYSIPGCVDSFLSNSSYFSELDSKNLNVPISKCVCFGFPRTDCFFDDFHTDFKELFCRNDFDKTIIWMPTFRENVNDQSQLYKSKEALKEINDYAKLNNLLIIFAPHFLFLDGYDYIKDFSNFFLLDNHLLLRNKIKFYSVLKETDALITDYSSVMIDYLLLNKPIALCWNDYEEYKSKIGFVESADYIFNCGKKVYSACELVGFMNDVINGVDELYMVRSNIRDKLFDYFDGKATKRVVDFLCEQIGANDIKY